MEQDSATVALDVPEFWNALTLIHGVYELIYTKGRYVLGFAWTCQLLCYGLMAWDASVMSNKYKAQPTTTYAFMERIEQFPEVTVCPQHQKYKLSLLLGSGKYSFMFSQWAWDSWQSHGGDLTASDNLLYALTGLHTSAYMKGLTYNSRLPEHGNASKYRETRDIMIDQLARILEERNMTQRQLEMKITGSFDDVILEVPGFPITNKRKTYTTIGTCYSFQVNSSFCTVPSGLWYNTARAKFRINRDNETLFLDEMERNVAHVSRIIFGPPGFFVQYPEYWLHQTSGRRWMVKVGEEPDRHVETTLQLSSMRFERQNRRSSPCNHWTDAEKSECMIACYNDEFCSKAPNYSSEPCLIENANMTVNETRRVCNWLRGDFIYTGQPDHCAAHKEILAGAYTPVHDICRDRCPNVCLEDLYYVVQAFDQFSEYKYPEFAEVTLLYGLKRFVLVETMMFNQLQFASNLASIISCWSGFTLFSIWTITYHSVRRGLLRRKRKSVTYST